MSETLDPRSQPTLKRPIALTKFACFVYATHIDISEGGQSWEGESQISIVLICMADLEEKSSFRANERGRPPAWPAQSSVQILRQTGL